MEFDSKYTIEVAKLENAGNLRNDRPLGLWVAQLTCGGYAPGLTERFLGDNAYDAARRACEYIVELENRK
jgi:hypothetical protein